MSESLRKTLGFDFDFDKFGSDDDNEGAGADLAAESGAAASAPGPTPLSSPEDEDRFDSMGDSADHVLAQYMEMARTPPRTSRREKEKKSYRHQAQAANKTLKASLKRRSSLDKFMSLPAFAENPEEASVDNVDSVKQGQQRRRGRLLQLERRAERLQKQRAGGELTFVVGEPAPEADAEERCASLKVETSSCFHSLSSKPVNLMSSPSPSPLRRRRQRPYSGDASPLSPADEASSPVSDRSEFHQWLSALVRLGSSERPDTRKRSREELRYQTELQDVLWLALQAYHAGESMQQVDQVLCSQRSQLPQLADDLLSFRFQPEAGAADCPAGGRRCLDVWCRPCLAAQRQALQQAAALMARMDAAERLYPSGQRLLQQQPNFRRAEFRRRLKTLYLWHNLTSQLWMRMRIIRQYLKGMGAGHLPWPELAPEAELCLSPSSSHAQPNVAGEEVPPVTPQDRPPPRVQFTDLAPSSNPSDSSSSNASDSAATDKRTPGSRGLNYHWSVSTASGTSEVDTEADDKTPYRKCVEKLLKTKGLKRTLSKLINHLKSILDQTHMALLPPDHQREGSPTGEVYSSGDGSSLGLDDRTALELRQFGELSDTSRDMNLPSFKPVYTWLSLVPLELTHECVRIRLQQQPQEPSALSIRQLIAECKEALRAAVTVRQRFIRRLRVLRPPAATTTTLTAGPPPTARLDATLESFDADVREMLEVYLRYIKRLLLLMQWEIEVSAAQKSLLEEEWAFAKCICPHIASGEAVAGRNFCFLVSDILPTIGDLLENGIDTCIASLQRSSSVPSGREQQRNRSSTLTTLREFRVLFHEARDRAQKALLFARLLRRDLELAAAFRLCSSPEGVLRRLADTGHVRVLAPHSHQHVIFIPGALQADRAQVWRLLDMTLSRQEPRGAAPGYLVLLACHDCGDVDALWRGTTIRLEPTAETTITLSYVEVKGLLLVVNNAGVLARARQPFQRAMGACLSLEREETPPNRAITDALEELKEEALKLRQVVANSVALVEEKCSAMLADPTGTSLAARCREVVQQCFKFAFEYHRELGRLVTGARRAELAPAMLDVASHWLRYVLEYCPSGCGLRPRWAREGLEFVNHATEPPHTQHMEETAFKMLQEQVKRCVRHLQAAISPLAGAGSRPSSPCDLSRPPYRASRSLPPPGEPLRPRHSAPGTAEPATPPSGRRDSLRRDSSERGLSDLASPVGSRSDGLDLSAGSVSPGRLSLDALPAPPLERARRAVAELDARRDERLHELRRIGHLSERRADRVHIKAKTVGFTWQMGFLIGQGRFGRVYTAVNNSTGELMAVKEIQLQPNDHRSLRAAAEELQLLEGVQHQHLVRYYGVEIHREEMFIFMEFCGEGTLESLSASAEGGLPEHLIRHYTKQLLSAVSCLHAHHIVHRDIKGANVFLTDECRCLKLGDFGCSVKIVAHTTMQGEVKGLVGTPAFMAPEVYTRSGSEGQGRAADVWSLGCCVVEMATGKRPFPDLDDTYQIMFRVGMGGLPALPDKLSQEGHQFLQLCFQHEPKKRALAHQLEDHPFVKVGSDPDEVLSSLPQSLMSGFTRIALS